MSHVQRDQVQGWDVILVLCNINMLFLLWTFLIANMEFDQYKSKRQTIPNIHSQMKFEIIEHSHE